MIEQIVKTAVDSAYQPTNKFLSEGNNYQRLFFCNFCINEVGEGKLASHLLGHHKMFREHSGAQEILERYVREKLIPR